MLPIVEQLNFLLGIATLVLQLVTVALIVLCVYEFATKERTPSGAFIARFAMPVAFLTSLGAMILTLVYSEVFGFVPCGLCWLQRVFMFPQVFITGVALWMRDRVFAPVYLIVLSIPGALIALYNHYIQMGGAEVVNCPAAGGDCAKRIMFEFGYITFPLMAFTLFVFLMTLMFIYYRHSKQEASV